MLSYTLSFNQSVECVLKKVAKKFVTSTQLLGRGTDVHKIMAFGAGEGCAVCNSVVKFKFTEINLEICFLLFSKQIVNSLQNMPIFAIL